MSKRPVASRFRIARPRPLSSLCYLGLVGVLVLGSGCKVAEARMWNLREVHEPNGRPRRKAKTQSDAAYLMERTLRTLELGANESAKAEEKPLADPLGTCFSNLVALSECDATKDMSAALMAEGFAWLAIDCTYALSRDRAARAMGPLAARLKVDKALPPPAEPAATDDITTAYQTLVVAAGPIVRGERGSSLDVRDAALAIGALQPDRAGTLRLLKATNVLLEEGGKKSALDPLRGLQRSLAKRALALALHEGMDDEDGRVVAAILNSRLMLEGENKEKLLEWTLATPHEGLRNSPELALEAIEWIAANGLPAQVPQEDGSLALDEGARNERWTGAFIQMLGEVQGQLVPACSRALARLTGHPATIRPEEWLAWWRWERDSINSNTTESNSTESDTASEAAARPQAASTSKAEDRS